MKGSIRALYMSFGSVAKVGSGLDTKAARHFLTKALNAVHTHEPRVINVDKNPAYPPAIEQLPFINQIFGLAA